MEKRTMGKTGMEVSVLGFGGAEIGFESQTDANVSTLLNAALDAGLNVIDTAECYWAGSEESSSERLIGEAVSHRRQDYFLFTKVGHGSGLNLPDWSPELLEASIERSLRRLKTDCVDLIQLHSCGEDLLKAGDVIAVLQKAKQAGKTRFIGYSGENIAANYAVSCGAFDTLQTSVNICDQRNITDWVAAAKRAEMGVIAKRPIANACWRWAAEAECPDYSKPYWRRLQKLDYDFLKTDHITQTALRFTLTVPGVHTMIVGTKNPARWAENAALATAGALSPEEFDTIRARWKAVVELDWSGQV
jgi:aryl-alcohol dehydrogenase-like predicted oxidoreductase